MKKFALICLFATLACGMANAQNDTQKDEPANGPKIRFTEMEHNYGDILKGSDGKCAFTFFNDGNEPLILQNVKASCGCTTPSWTQKPVMPGESGTIDVKYNTNNVGNINKTITVTSNAVNNPRVTLRIKGNVKQESAQPTPAPAERNPKAEPKIEPRRDIKELPAPSGRELKDRKAEPKLESRSR